MNAKSNKPRTSDYPLREIKSFVRREGRMTEGQKRALEALFPEFGILYDLNNILKNSPKNKIFLNLESIFGNQHPVVLEIGFGMGDSLISMAESQPHLNFIGIEVHRPGIGVLLNKIEEKNLKNIRVMDGDAVEILKNLFADESLARVNLYFPDPWHKTRHHKRRIVQKGFLKLLARKLVPGGIFHAATDWENYAEHMMSVLSDSPYFFNLFGEHHFSPDAMDRPETKFERRGLKLGHGVWDLVFIREQVLPLAVFEESEESPKTDELIDGLLDDLLGELSGDASQESDDAALESPMDGNLLDGLTQELPADPLDKKASSQAANNFVLDPRLEGDSFLIGDFDLSQCRLMNAREFPWLLLIPRKAGLRDWIDLSFEDQIQLQGEINQASQMLKEMFPDWPAEKLNIASLGNKIPQLHIHIILRNSKDMAWPNPVWGMKTTPYSESEMKKFRIAGH
jgi:tRNA (guanine-N7-)-methyltransferase